MPLGFESTWGGGTEAAETAQQHGLVLGPSELASLAAAAFKEPLSSALGTSPRPSPPPLPPPAKQKPRSWVTFDSQGSRDPLASAPAGLGDDGFAPLDTAPSASANPSQQQPAGTTSGFEDSWGMERGGAWTRACNAFDADHGSASGAPFPERSAPASSAADWAENGGEWAPTSTAAAADWADDAEFQAPSNFGFTPSARPDCMVSG